MKQTSKRNGDRQTRWVMLTVLVVLVAMLAVAFLVCYQAAKSETNVRYMGIMNIASEKIAKTIRGMEMNAMNEFDEVEKHLDSPETVIAALESKTSLNPDVRGYFAAFEPDFFPEQGTWFEPYVHHNDSSDFEVTLVGSARHNYHKSGWYVRAKAASEQLRAGDDTTGMGFWSDPYYYYDGTNISGHYCTYVKPVFDAQGQLACVCGADITFEWLSKELLRIDEDCKNELLSMSGGVRDTDFYAVVINSDGSCIAHPEGKSVPLTDKDVISNLAQKKSGVIEMTVGGVPSTVYYGPIDHIDWSVALVVPHQGVMKSLLRPGLILLSVAVVGWIVVWVVCRRRRNAETI